MRIPQIDFLNPETEQKRRKKIKTLLKISSAFIVISAGLFFLASFLLSYIIPSNASNKPSFIERMMTLLPAKERKLIGEEDDAINVLLLGMGGAGHEGPFLTDTIVLASFAPKEKKAVLLSIPRDLVVPTSDYGWIKINHINAFAEVKKPNEGGNETRKILSSVFDIPIPYYVRMDFEGFKKIIDDLGGITVNVKRGFTDTQYPTKDFKTKTVTFPEGWQVMDGERALEFVRSRHGNNDEGTDFARSRRQQQVILAVKDKIFSMSTLLSPLRLVEAMQTINQHLDTNFEIWEILRLANLINDAKNENILTYVLDASPTGLLYAEMYEGAYVLLPKNGWMELKQFVKDIFSNKIPSQITQNRLKETKIEVQNGTKINGLAAGISKKLEEAGLNVIFYGNASNQNFEKTLIFNLSEKDQTEILKKISEIVKGDVINKNDLPDQTIPLTHTQSADILIILGKE
jgi:LCP family protein required for cell wall assembly